MRPASQSVLEAAPVQTHKLEVSRIVHHTVTASSIAAE